MDPRTRVFLLIASVLGGSVGGAINGWLLYMDFPTRFHLSSIIILCGAYHGACLGTAIGFAANMRTPLIGALLLSIPLGWLSPLLYWYTQGGSTLSPSDSPPTLPPEVLEAPLTPGFFLDWVGCFALPVILASTLATRQESRSEVRGFWFQIIGVVIGAHVFWGIRSLWASFDFVFTGLIHGVAFGFCMAIARLIGRALAKPPPSPS